MIARWSQLQLDSGHSRLSEPRTNEFELELDVEGNESVSFQISDFAYAGNQGYNLRRHTEFYGTLYDNAASGTTQNLSGIYFGGSYIFAVGPQGTFVSRGPKGNSFPNWTVQTSPATGGLQGVWGAADNKVYAVGDALTILYWDGAALIKVPLPNITANLTRKLNAVWGTSATNVYAVGEGGTILHYLP